MLVLCPTPIGNLDDVTERQRQALQSADVIACEDSRTTGKLLELLGIARVDGVPELVSYHDHNARDRAPQLVERLLAGDDVVLVSDAGTPSISDPGYRLVSLARDEGIEVTVLPGPVAAVLALAGSGLEPDRWSFEGFAPSKQGARRTRLERARAYGGTAVFYESPNRVISFVEDVVHVFGAEHRVCVARELTKRYEEWFVGAAAEILADLEGRDRLRGEFVVVIAPHAAAETKVADVDPWIQEMMTAGVKPAVIKRVVSSVTGWSKSRVFDRMEVLKS